MVGTNWPLVATAAGSAGGGGRARHGRRRRSSRSSARPRIRGRAAASSCRRKPSRVNDSWDGTGSRQRRFVELLRARHPRAELRNLNPILDEMRSIKSPREIAMVRRASQIAGLGLMEAMRSTEPGVTEYQLDAAARYVFLVNDARLEGYRSITASGTENINNMHYFRNTSTLKDGDLVLMDYAPDYRYYVSDIGRVWPVNGKYSARQRELLQFVLEFHKAVLSRIRPGVTATQIHDEAKKAMEPVFARTKFSKPMYETGGAHARRDRRRRVFTHRRHGGARRRRLPQRSAQARSGLLDRSAAVGAARRTSTCASRTRSSSPKPASRTSRISCRWSSTTWRRLVLEKGVVQKVPPIPASAIKKR